MYPVRERLLFDERKDEHDIVLVDVGGGKGHDLSRFATLHMSDIKEPRLVLQDLPDVIEHLTSVDNPLPPSIKAMAHDFFTPQPVRGARGYYLHR